MLRDSKATLVAALLVVIGCGSDESGDRPGPPGTGTSPPPELDASTSPSAGGSSASGGTGGNGTGGSDGGEGGSGGSSPSDASSNPFDVDPGADFRDGAPPGPVCPETGVTCVDYCEALSRSATCVDVFNAFEGPNPDGGVEPSSDAGIPENVVLDRCECDCEMRIRTGCGGFFDEYIVCADEPLELVCALEVDSGQPLPEVVGACGSIADQLFACLDEVAVRPDAGP